MQSFALSKPDLDVGFFTNRVDDTLSFWREEIGLEHEPPVHFNDGLVQYRHRLGNSIVKINGAEHGVDENVPGGYGELVIAEPGRTASESKIDPDGNVIRFVPPGEHGITAIGISVYAPDVDAERKFFLNAMRFAEEPTSTFAAGNAKILLHEAPDRPYAGHWVSCGFRYFTLHVMRVDETFDAIVANGGTVGERPYAIGDIAKISFVRSPAGNWIEVAQRRELAGPW